jgi:spore coat protein U-like protein
MLKNKIKKSLLVGSILFFTSTNNLFAADTASGTITASGTVTGTCTVAASNMVFGTLNQSGTTTATSTVTPTCSNGTVWTITNAADTNNLYLGGSSGTAGGTDGTILFPIIVTSGSAAFTLAGASTGKLTGTGNGSAQPQTTALTGTAASASGKTAGIYGGTVTLTLTY